MITEKNHTSIIAYKCNFCGTPYPTPEEADRCFESHEGGVWNAQHEHSCITTMQYPNVVDMMNDDTNLILLAKEFEIPYMIKTMTEGGSEWGGIGTYYDVDYIEFDMSKEELEALVESGLRGARLYVRNLVCLRKEMPKL